MIQVLVVEDDPMVMEITCKYVDSVPGFKVVRRAGSSPAAETALKETTVDLMILDIFMPGKNGVDLLAELRSRGYLTDVVFLTAADDTDFINRAQKLGFVDYLIKPFSYERFRDSLVHYQKMRELLHTSGKTTQEELDNTLRPGLLSESSRVHKGMHPKTLEIIRNCLDECPEGSVITQAELVERLGLSKVTVRRYMEYLVSTGEVAVEMVYGSVGRPSYTYRKIR